MHIYLYTNIYLYLWWNTYIYDISTDIYQSYDKEIYMQMIYT